MTNTSLSASTVVRCLPPNAVFGPTTSYAAHHHLHAHVETQHRSNPGVSASSTLRRRSPVHVPTTLSVDGHAWTCLNTTTANSSSYDYGKPNAATTITTTTATTSGGSVSNRTATKRHSAEGFNAESVRRQMCAGCGREIADRFLLRAIDSYWHTTCLRCSAPPPPLPLLLLLLLPPLPEHKQLLLPRLRCSACQAALADLGPTCFTRASMTLCRKDYIR